eukprot:TRINITY_DN35261_c0_g1_i1.p1 TRINITY_DN35261_c0_g1~~TRINITY_DN35261_c0_g1_i1.p1  ORF type:complete len:596 (+),score=151.57 TRINITY_DN35261_c0_g1_i1:124-1788(+)
MLGAATWRPQALPAKCFVNSPYQGTRCSLLAGWAPCTQVRLSATGSATAVEVEKDYEALASRLKELSALEGIGGLLGWDEMTMMPPGAAQARSAQKAALSGVIHAKSTDPEIGTLLGRLQEGTANLDQYKQATIREAARGYKKRTCIPEDLVRREAELESRAYQAWVQARTEKKWELFAPALKEWVEVRRERAALIDPTAPAYDVLADDYDAGLTAARVTEVFSRVRDGLVPLLKDIRERGKKPDDAWLQGDFDTAKQAALCKEVAVDLGFNLEKGRLDVSVHPFTGGAHPTDVRMTTRFKPHDITEGLTGAIHETGHALYEQGRNLEQDGLPVNMAAGMAIHESQSLLWERMVGLSRPFAKYLLPKFRSAFPEAFSEDRTPEALYDAINTVKETSMIRVEADEVTYPMHVILRFEIEKGLIDGTVEVEDVPALWGKKMKDYLGVEPADDAQGCLQDMHWSMGAIGYFPTYTLGAMSAVQIFEVAKKDLPGLDDDIAAGNFSPLREWLNKNVHALGSLYPKADDLLEAVTGKALDPDIFLKYLQEKYREIYQLS